MKFSYSLVVLFCLYFSSTFAQQWGDYTLYSVQNSSTTYLIDTNSAVYHSWTHATNDKTGYSSYLMPDKTLWRTVKTSTSINGGGVHGKVQKVAWDGTVLWDYTYSSSTYVLHHDICPLPNGNVLLISYDVKSATESAAAGRTANGSIYSEKVMEVQPTGLTTGTIVWEWKLWDHLVQNVDATKANYQTSISAHPELMNVNYNSSQQDWVHMNGIDYNPMLDQIALSSHNLNMWFIIDHSTTTAQAATHTGGNAGKGGDFLYRYGNPGSYGMSGSTVLNVTHDAHWIPEGCPDAGRLVGFNNKGVSNNQSSVDQINLPTITNYNYAITAGQPYAPLIYDERLACNGATSNMGNSQQLPNGNALVCMATQGTIYEVDPAGTTIWTKTVSGTVAQAFRYSDCYVNGTPIEIPTITANNNVLTSTSAASYQWYFNGQLIQGATNQSYTATQTGIYLVRTSDAAACFKQYSTGLMVQVGGGTNSLDELTTSDFSVYPNPSNSGIFSISAKNHDAFTVTVFNVTGKEVLSQSNLNTIDLSICENGIYFVRIQTTENTNEANNVAKQELIKLVISK